MGRTQGGKDLAEIDELVKRGKLPKDQHYLKVLNFLKKRMRHERHCINFWICRRQEKEQE